MRHALILLFAILAVVPAADDAAARTKAEQLLEAMKTGEQLAAAMEANFQKLLQPSIDQAAEDERPALAQARAAGSTFVRENMAWATLKNDFVTLYATTFTVEELDAMLAFYRSPLGQRLVERAPAITSRTMALTAERMEHLMPDLQRIVAETMGKAHTANKAKKFESAGLVVGKPFPALELTTTDGGKLTTTDLVGKVVLIDYWATWCGPCVREMPNVLKTYQQFHDQGFEVIGISLDEDLAQLATFVAEQQLPWKQACDGKGWQSDAAKRFGINSIPATFLIAKDGTLAAVDVRGDDLAAAVERALQAK